MLDEAKPSPKATLFLAGRVQVPRYWTVPYHINYLLCMNVHAYYLTDNGQENIVSVDFCSSIKLCIFSALYMLTE